MRITYSPLLTRIDECMATDTYPDPRADALMRAYLHRKAILAAWDRTVATVQADGITYDAIAAYTTAAARLAEAGMLPADEIALGR